MTQASPQPRTGVCAPLGFRAAAAAAAVRDGGHAERLDVAIIASDLPCAAAGVFTRNLVKAAPVVISQLTLRRGGPIHAVVVNSGNANACTGPQGFRDALRMATITADQCGADPAEVLVCSTGVIGRAMPMDRVAAGIGAASRRLDAEAGDDFAAAIMTTDTVPKTAIATADLDGVRVTVGGTAKGSGMIHPDMATLLGFLTTDAGVDRELLQSMLAASCARTFNCLSIDGDTSTNDTVLLLANDAAGAGPVASGSAAAAALAGAIDEVCTSLVEQLAADAEGATRALVVDVRGAATELEARAAARTVVGSPLVKTAVHGADPNWGRIVAALGRSGAGFSLDRCHVAIGGVEVFAGGRPVLTDLQAVRAAFVRPRIVIDVELNNGDAHARAWGCDLSADYVSINADYTT